MGYSGEQKIAPAPAAVHVEQHGSEQEEGRHIAIEKA
jgi:hypothetical protein